MRNKYKFATVIFAALGNGAGTVLAQPVDAGVLQQQIERERQQALPRQYSREVTPAPAEMRPPTGLTVVVKEFRFVGNTLLPASRLSESVKPYLGRPIDFTELQAAALVIADLYRESGWIVRAYIPEQEIENGQVVIQIIEAIFGKLGIDGEFSAVSEERIRQTFELQQQSGQLLNAEALDRALLLADDLPGVAVSGALRAGDGQAETDLVLKVSEEKMLVGDAILDNYGSRSTGKERLAGNFQVASPFRLGDLLSTNLMHTEGSDYGRLAYSVPLGYGGWRVGLNASTFAYNLVGKEFANLNAEGRSASMGLDATYPLLRSRNMNLMFTGSYDNKSYQNDAKGARISEYDIDVVNLGFSGNLFDQLWGGGANTGNLTFSIGRRDAKVGPTDQTYSKVRFSLSRQQALSTEWSFFALLSGQYAGKDLDSSEKFYLGGANGVRAYPSNEGGGANGQMMNLELRWRLPNGLMMTGFYDYGRVENYDRVKSYSLQGAGLSLGWMSTFGLSTKAVWAHRIGTNPNPAANGNDQDGSLTNNRFWLMISQSF